MENYEKYWVVFNTSEDDGGEKAIMHDDDSNKDSLSDRSGRNI